jgi:cytidylate kinase
MEHRLRIAIDGPAASGKSTTAKLVAKELHYLYIDTGAMYRAITLAALRNKVDIHNGQALSELATRTSIELRPERNDICTFLNGMDVTNEIRMPQVTKVISVISAHQVLREIMVGKQQQLAKDGAVVMDGRDIGTHVLPDAEIKIFMIADLRQRAQRRYDELRKKGVHADLNEIESEIQHRDELDSSRAASPLKPAPDAIHIDTSNLSIPQQVKKVLQIVQDYIQNSQQPNQ